MTEEFWKQKLKAFLHDPPCKCFGIAGHENAAASFMKAAGFSEEEVKSDTVTAKCDRTASAADRFLFPKPQVMHSEYLGNEASPFRHPFGDGIYYSEKEIPTAAFAEECFQNAIGIVDTGMSWRDKFLLYWRRWPEEAGKSDTRLAFLPADTRIPDHTIWNHIGLTSALRACCNEEKLEAAFLLFQIGPVQEFIECARSTRDCWSGSYILSWLMSKALAAVAMAIGPDNVIFPSLRGQPFFDLAMKEIYEKIPLKDEQSLWNFVSKGMAEKLKIPTIPNRFLLLVSASRADEMAELAENAVRTEWAKIADYAWNEFAKITTETVDSWRERWQNQVENFLQIHYQVMDWDDALKNSELEKMAQKVPLAERDDRYFSDSAKSRLNNIGCTWNVQFKRVSKAFAARHVLRDFAQFAPDKNVHLSGAPKDALSGVEEVIGSEELWKNLCSDADGAVFKSNEGPYGAISITKRFFRYYLQQEIPDFKLNFHVASTQEIAGKRNYFAVLAMDGDEIGKRLSGSKAKCFLDSLSVEGRRYFEKFEAFQEYKRPMSPAIHAQFSECLANFALHLVEPVVKSFGGQLIYAGGDDVLAMLPAQNALAAALALRSVFRGETPEVLNNSRILAEKMGIFKEFKIDEKHRGWVAIPAGKEQIPLMMPGSDCDVSCGIAIAHEKFPLQRAIKKARQAEKRAKNEYGRSAFAMSLLKRSGEIIHWGAKWEHAAIELFYAYFESVQNDDVGNRLPYTLAQLIAPYDLENDKCTLTADEMRDIIYAEFAGVCTRQWPKGIPQLDCARRYLAEIQAKYGTKGFGDFVKLFLSVAFIFRGENEEVK